MRRMTYTGRWGALALSLLLGLWPASQAHAQVSFDDAVNFGTGNGPTSVATGDLDGDGIVDLAVANQGTNDVSILLGNGDGTFDDAIPPTVLTGGVAPTSVAIGDLDGDGILDLAVANNGTSNISILLGNGDGTFDLQPFVGLGTGTEPRSVAIGDLDRDGILDLAVANNGTNDVSILLGNGDGTFDLQPLVGTGTEPVSVAIGDLDRDGILDLAVANNGTSNVSILLGNGDGTFDLQPLVGTGTEPVSVAIGDLDGDGILDLAVANNLSNNVSILLGNGDGTFAPQPIVNTRTGPVSIAIDDLDGDGDLDLAVASAGTSSVAIHINDGTGAFPEPPSTFGTGNTPSAVAIADLDRDGKLDLAVTSQGTASVSVLLNTTDFDPSGTFDVKVKFATGTGPVSVAIGDLDRNGAPDLAVANQTADSVSILLGDGSGAFGAKTDFATGTGPSAVAIADLDRDGIPDLAVTNFTDDTVSILLGDGDGTFTAATPATVPVGTDPSAVAIADLNRDGIPDLAVTNEADDTVSILLGDGDGTFTAATPATVATGTGPSSVAIADLNRDGILDLAVANFTVDTVSVLFGDGTGAFGTKTDFGTDPSAVAIADLDRDGTPDLALTNNTDNNVAVLFNIDPTAVSTAPPTGGGGGASIDCFIATAAYGSPLASQVQLLREFRDRYLLPHAAGRALVAVYYTLSPPLADLIAQSEILRAIVRAGLVPVFGWAALVLWSPSLALCVLLGVLGLGGWLTLRIIQRRKWACADQAVPRSETRMRSGRAVLRRKLALLAGILFALAAAAFLEAGPRELPLTEHGVDVIGEVRLPQAVRFALIRDEETGRLGLYKDGEGIFQGQEPLPLGKIIAVHDETLVLAMPSGRTIQIARGARLPGPRHLIFVRSALVDALSFQVRSERTAKSGGDYYVVDMRGRRAILERTGRATAIRGAPRRPNAERTSLGSPSGSERTTLAEILNRTPFTEVAPDTWEIPEENVKEFGTHLGPLLAEALSSVRPSVSFDGGIGLTLNTSLGSGTLNRRGFEIQVKSLARRTGLEVGDRILSVSGEPVNSLGGLIGIYRGLKRAAASEVKVVIQREKELRTLTYRIR